MQMYILGISLVFPDFGLHTNNKFKYFKEISIKSFIIHTNSY